MFNQLGTFENDKAIVECVAFVGFAKAGGNYAWDTEELQCGSRLFARRAGAEVVAANDQIARFGLGAKLGIVVFENHCCHLFGSHGVVVSMLAGIDAVGI